MLAVLVPAAMMAADTNAAMLYATNRVSLNGSIPTQSSAVFAGDTIQTPSDSAVTLTTQGSTVVVGPSSLLVYQGDVVRLGLGTTMVTTEKGMKTEVQKLLVSPAAKGRSSYRVARTSGKVMIAALRGSLKISDGSSEKTVAEGNSATIADPSPAPDTPGAVPGAGGGAISHISTGLALGIATGAGVLGALLAIETTKKGAISGQ